MTVAAIVPVTNSVAAAAQTVFPFVWRADDPSTVLVIKNTVTLALNAYIVTLNADQSNNPGGIVTLVTPAALNDAIKIVRSSPLQQVVALTPFGQFTALALMLALDRVAMMVQELSAIASGAGAGTSPPPSTTFVPNEVPGGLVNSTNGIDGNGAYTLAHAAVDNAHLFILVDGVRQPPSRWTRASGSAIFTFNSGFHPTTGSDVRADYYF